MPKILKYYKIPEKDSIEVEKLASHFFCYNLNKVIRWTESELSKISLLEKSDLHEYNRLFFNIHTGSSNKMIEILAERERMKESFKIESRFSEYERKLKD